MEVFWKTIAQYNEGTWIAQIVITVVGILLTYFSIRNRHYWSSG